jgi:uncharacterized ParB-like nuclease family protein
LTLEQIYFIVTLTGGEIMAAALSEITNLFSSNPQFKCFQREYGHLKISSRNYNGIKPIPIEKITGTVGRCQQQENFSKLKKTNRYYGIKEATKNQEHLPAIKVYEAEGEYYIVDGHHRVMAAQETGKKFIDAEITKYQFSEPKDEEYHGCEKSPYRNCIVTEKQSNSQNESTIKYKHKKILVKVRKLNRLLPYKKVIEAWRETDLFYYLTINPDDKESEK